MGDSMRKCKEVMQEKRDVENKVLEFCREGQGVNGVRLDSKLDHLGFDDWDKGVIAENLEETYKITIPQDIAVKWETVQDIIDVVLNATG